MISGIIDNEINDIFFKFYKKDIQTIEPNIYQNLSLKISQNVDKLIQNKDAKSIILEKISDYQFCFFHVVAKFGNPNDLKKLIELVGINNLNHGDINNFTALHHCSISGRVDNLKILIGFGANINAKSSIETRNWYPIHMACKFGYQDIVKEFIECGVNKEVITSFGLTPLHVACEYGNHEIAKYLISIGCNLESETVPENHRMTPLHYAVIINSLKTVEILCNAGADIFKKTIQGSDALNLATRRNFVKIVEFLINRGMVKNIDNARQVAIDNNCHESLKAIDKFVIIRKKLFNKSFLLKSAKEINNFLEQINPQNIGDSYLSLFDEYDISAYFLGNVAIQIGFFKKKNYTLEEYSRKIGLDIISRNLKNLNEIILHTKIKNKY